MEDRFFTCKYMPVVLRVNYVLGAMGNGKI